MVGDQFYPCGAYFSLFIHVKTVVSSIIRQTASLVV